MLPWKIAQTKTVNISGVDIPDYGGWLVNEHQVLLWLYQMQQDEKITPAQANEVLVAYCLAFRLNQDTEAEIIFEAIQSGEYTDSVAEACDLLLPPPPKGAPQRSMGVIDELFTVFRGAAEGKGQQTGAESSGSSSSTTPSTLALVPNASDVAQSA